jgi:hypothetical protein
MFRSASGSAIDTINIETKREYLPIMGSNGFYSVLSSVGIIHYTTRGSVELHLASANVLRCSWMLLCVLSL